MAVIVDAGPQAGEPAVALLAPMAQSAEAQYFPDGRDGVDRWGTEREGKTACGTGWGPGEYVCPLYEVQACPGERNWGTRWSPSARPVCDLACGACGGGMRTDTTDFCGHPRGWPGLLYAMWEMGGLRLDEYMAPPAKAPAPWPCSYAPVAEWGAKTWMPELHAAYGGAAPLIFTTVKSSRPGNKREPTPLRERFGTVADPYQGLLGVVGLVKDDLLDDCWEDRHRLIEFCAASGLNIMVTPQFSYYDSAETAGWIYNVARSFEWYRLSVEAGIPTVALDCPPFLMPWLYQEYFDFIDRNAVKCIAISLQTFSYIHPVQLQTFLQLNEALAPDAAVIIFGVNTPSVFGKVAKAFEGRSLLFANVEPFAKGAFYRLLDDRRAPAGWSQAQTFAWNARQFQDRAQAVLDALNQEHHDPLPEYRPPIEGEDQNKRRRRSSRRTPRPRAGSRRSKTR